MRLWRICRRAHASNPLSGRGGLVAGGRWHPKGRRVVYTSETLSLAVLELLVHTDKDLLPSDLIQIKLEVPDSVPTERVDLRTLPPDWRSYPAPLVLQELGAHWIDRGASAVLRVPSAVVPVENNFLLNPEHRSARRFRIVAKERFVLDARLAH